MRIVAGGEVFGDTRLTVGPRAASHRVFDRNQAQDLLDRGVVEGT
jgi:hypothetical protein